MAGAFWWCWAGGHTFGDVLIVCWWASLVGTAGGNKRVRGLRSRSPKAAIPFPSKFLSKLLLTAVQAVRFSFETGSSYIALADLELIMKHEAQAGFKVMILLPQPLRVRVKGKLRPEDKDKRNSSFQVSVPVLTCCAFAMCPPGLSPLHFASLSPNTTKWEQA